MNMTRHQNKLRKNFVIKLITQRPGLTNADISRKLKLKYGSGMDSNRITKYRDLAIARVRRALRATLPEKDHSYKPLPPVAKKHAKPVQEHKKEIVRAKNGALPFHPEVRESLEHFKQSVCDHYSGGVVYLNIASDGKAVVKFHLQPKPPAATTGKFEL